MSVPSPALFHRNLLDRPRESHAFGKDNCPICGRSGAKAWLRAPDRFHGRKDRYTLLRCPNCLLVWLANPPEPEDLHLHYTEAYNRLIAEAGENSPMRWAARKTTLLAHKQAGNLLDLGCSSGAFLQALSREDWNLYGIEMSLESAKKARLQSGADVTVGEIIDTEFPPESFDAITCFDVLEHLYEPRKVLAKVARWLKPGGILYILVPNIESAESRIFGTYWHGLELPRHLFHYSPRSLRLLAASAGLQEVTLETRRNPAVGISLRYAFDDLFRAFRIRRTPVACRSRAALLWRAVCKLSRMTLLPCLFAVAPLVGGGESIHAIFQKKNVPIQ